MELVGYQNRYADELYDALMKEEKSILFCGEKGCGKSAILNGLIDKLQENWKVFLIKGAGKDDTPYSTLFSFSNKLIKDEKYKIKNISLGLNIQPEGIPFGFSIEAEIDEETFNNNEYAIINAIKKESNGNDNILIIAEDYNSWDSASRSMLNKLVNVDSKEWFDGKNLHRIMTDVSINNVSDAKIITICVDNIDEHTIEKIVAQKTSVKGASLMDWKNIISYFLNIAII